MEVHRLTSYSLFVNWVVLPSVHIVNSSLPSSSSSSVAQGVWSDTWQKPQEALEISLAEWLEDRFWSQIYLLCREGNGTPLQYSCLENPMDGGAWWATVHGVAKSRTRLRDFTFTFHFHALEKEMATHSRVLAWRIPGTGEHGGLPPMGSHRVGHN